MEFNKKTITSVIDKNLLIILFFAIVVGLLRFFVIYAIAGDAPLYIKMAKMFYVGDFTSALRVGYHPLYPALMALVYPVIHNWVAAGQVISFIFGTLTVLPIYFMARETFGQKVANIAAIFFVIQPFLIEFRCEILSEAIYIFLFASAVWLSWKALHCENYLPYFGAGLVAGLSYLARTEGLGVPIVTAFYIIFRNFPSIKVNYRKKVFSLVMLALGLIIFIGPYCLFIKADTGQWRLSYKKSIFAAIGLFQEDMTIPDKEVSSTARIPSYSRLENGYFNTLAFMTTEYPKVYYFPLFLLSGFSLLRRNYIHRKPSFEWFIALMLLFYFAVCSLFYATDRHIVPLISVSLFWAAIGFYELYDVILTKLNFVKLKLIPVNDSGIFSLLLASVIIITLPYTFRPKDRDKVGQRKVGEWMKENCEQHPFVLTDSSRVAFYADGYFVSFQNRPGIGNYVNLMKFAKTPYAYEGKINKINYIVIDKSTITKFCSDFLESVSSKELEIIHIQPKLPHSLYGDLIVYKIL